MNKYEELMYKLRQHSDNENVDSVQYVINTIMEIANVMSEFLAEFYPDDVYEIIPTKEEKKEIGHILHLWDDVTELYSRYFVDTDTTTNPKPVHSLKKLAQQYHREHRVDIDNIWEQIKLEPPSNNVYDNIDWDLEFSILDTIEELRKNLESTNIEQDNKQE